MTRQEREEKINQVLNMASDIKHILDGIVWENQEGQEEHFDKLNKGEKIAITGCFNDACHLVTSLAMYQSWFVNK